MKQDRSGESRLFSFVTLPLSVRFVSAKCKHRHIPSHRCIRVPSVSLPSKRPVRDGPLPMIRGKWMCTGAPTRPKANPEDVLTAEQMEVWEQVAAEIHCLDPDAFAGEEDALVAKAFGWGPTSQRFWRGDVVEEPPSLERVKANLHYLSLELGLSNSDIAKILKVFPEVIRLDVEGRIRKNVDLVQITWNLSGERFTETVRTHPQVLGYDVDCSGDCLGECARCWARF